MDPQVAIALIGAITTIALAFFKLLGEIRATHRLVNSRMDELLELTRVSSLAKGRLAGELVGETRGESPRVADKLDQSP